MDHKCSYCLLNVFNGELKNGILTCTTCKLKQSMLQHKQLLDDIGKTCKKCGDIFLSKYLQADYCEVCKNKVFFASL